MNGLAGGGVGAGGDGGEEVEVCWGGGGGGETEQEEMVRSCYMVRFEAADAEVEVYGPGGVDDCC